MELVRKNKKGKVTHILGMQTTLVIGLLLMAVGFLCVVWLYVEDFFEFLSSFYQ